MNTLIRFRWAQGVALLTAGLLAGPAWALIDPKNPNATLYERPPANAVTPPPPVEAFPELKKDAAGYWLVDFAHLASFSFGRHKVAFDEEQPTAFSRGKVALLVPDESDAVIMPTEPGTSGTIPSNVQALDGKRVRITGYMLPIKMENGLVKDFLLLRNQMMCCYGRRPELNEWVVVKMKGPGVPSTMDTPLAFYGTLHVGELFENQIFEGLYELEGEKVSVN